MACDPDTLIAAATTAGWCEVTSVPVEMAELYDIWTAAGLTATTPATIVTDAKCNIAAVGGNIFMGVKQYLLCKLAGG